MPLDKIMTENILGRKIKEIYAIGEKINAPTWLVEELTSFKHISEWTFRARIKERLKLFTVTAVYHRNPHSTGARPYKGGLRFHPDVSLELLKVLAMDMTEKHALAGLPFGGAKGGIPIDPAKFTQQGLREITEKMTMELLKENTPHPDIYVPGPDVGTNADIMYWIYNKVAEMNHFRNIPNSTAVVTGKPLDHDGIPGREDATAHGLLLQLKEYRRVAGIKFKSTSPTMVIQGFGNVGANLATLAREKRFGYTVIAVSDKVGGIYNPKGLDVAHAQSWYLKYGTFKEYPHADHVTNQELLELKTDVLVPAAIENQITEKNAPRINAGIISEGANEAITQHAHEILWERKIPAVPGIVANVGGAVVSYLEWRKNRGERKHRVDFADDQEWVNTELAMIMNHLTENVHTRSIECKCSLAHAARMCAMEILHARLKEKHGYTE